MAERQYNRGWNDVLKGVIRFTTDAGVAATTEFAMLLVSTGYLDVADIEDQDTVLFAPNSSQSPEAFELSSTTGYGRQVMSTAWVLTEVDADNESHVTGSTTITFATVSSGAGVIGAAIIYASVAASDSSGRFMLGFYDSGFPITPNGGDVLVSASSGGWFQKTT